MKIAIVGASPSKEFAPYSDPSWEIWTCGPGTVGVPRVDFHFEMHSLAEIAKCCSESYNDYLRELPCYMQDRFPQFPRSIEYPKDEMLGRFGDKFFSSSIAWMLALAITKEPETIGLLGVDMLAADEYLAQRPGCFRFIELAMERGIGVITPDDCGLLRREKLYGYDE